MVPYDVLAFLYDQVKYLELNGIECDFVECGVWKGGAVGVMAAASQKYASHIRNIHLFDAFDDIPLPDPLKDGERTWRDIAHFSGADPALMKGELEPVRGIYNSFGGHGTIEECRSLLIGEINYPPQNVFFYKGWFQDTHPANVHRIQKIALLRLDGDWYESTKICLIKLFDKVVTGGIVIIDDYGVYDGCRRAVDEFLFSHHIKKYLINASVVNSECFFFIK